MAEAEAAVLHGITSTVADPEAVRALAAAAKRAGRRALAVHLKLDTGLARFGAQPEELPALLEALASEPVLEVEGIASHFATADEPDLSFARQQLARFQAALATPTKAGRRKAKCNLESHNVEISDWAFHVHPAYREAQSHIFPCRQPRSDPAHASDCGIATSTIQQKLLRRLQEQLPDTWKS